jgi:hypothetical protein
MLLSNVRVPSTGCRLSVTGCIRPLFVGLPTDFELSEEIVNIPSRQYPDGSVSLQLDPHISIETMTSDPFVGYGRSFAGVAGLLDTHAPNESTPHLDRPPAFLSD